jgi:rhodanese-related sulfurtransferase
MQTITKEEVSERMKSGESLNLVDVREPAEHEAFNIGGILLPLGRILSMQAEEIEDLKNEEVICYCRSGQRSMQATMMLGTMGFTNVKNLAGGMLAWQEMTGNK